MGRNCHVPQDTVKACRLGETTGRLAGHLTRGIRPSGTYEPNSPQTKPVRLVRPVHSCAEPPLVQPNTSQSLAENPNESLGREVFGKVPLIRSLTIRSAAPPLRGERRACGRKRMRLKLHPVASEWARQRVRLAAARSEPGKGLAARRLRPRCPSAAASTPCGRACP